MHEIFTEYYPGQIKTRRFDYTYDKPSRGVGPPVTGEPVMGYLRAAQQHYALQMLVQQVYCISKHQHNLFVYVSMFM